MLLSELISSKNQLKWIQKVWARPISRYSPRKYAEIEPVQLALFAIPNLRTLQTSVVGGVWIRWTGTLEWNGGMEWNGTKGLVITHGSGRV